MAVDGPYDGDPADDAIPPEQVADRLARSRLDAAADNMVTPLDRESSYHELRKRDSTEIRHGADAPTTTPEGAWNWKGLELDPQTNRLADQAIAARREAEGRDDAGNYAEAGITPAMRRIEAELEHGTLVPDTERFALKSPDRFKEKLAKAITLEPDSAPAELATRIHDGIRYTFTFDEGSYSEGVRQAERSLAAQGFEMIGRKPSWQSQEYKGINTQWHDGRSGQLFEVQFHTPTSWEAKQRTHDAYEMTESPATPPEERTRLRAYQRKVMESVHIPAGALEFTRYKAEGRQLCLRLRGTTRS